MGQSRPSGTALARATTRQTPRGRREPRKAATFAPPRGAHAPQGAQGRPLSGNRPRPQPAPRRLRRADFWPARLPPPALPRGAPTGADPAKGANPRRPPGRDGGARSPGPAGEPCGHRVVGLPVTAVPTPRRGQGRDTRTVASPGRPWPCGEGAAAGRHHVPVVRKCMLWPCEKAESAARPWPPPVPPVMIQGHPCAALPILARKIRPQSWRLRPAVFRPAPPSRARQGPAASPQGMRAGVPRRQSAYGRRPASRAVCRAPNR